MLPDWATTNPLLLLVSAATFGAALVGAIFAALNYWRKKGLDIRGSYSLVSSIASEEKYIGSITLENLKDRPAVIFKILLEVGHGYFIELDGFENDPLILGAFEAVTRSYDPIDFYSAGTRQIDMKNLLGQDAVRHRLVLSTSQGRYNVESRLYRWSPMVGYFRNHLTTPILPMRSTYEGQAYGSEVKYIVHLEWDDRKDEIIPIYPGAHRRRTFRSFELTADALESKEALETFLIERTIDEDLLCNDLSVIDVEEWRHDVYARQKKDVWKAPRRGWFIYHVVGFFVTRWHNITLKWKNWRRRRRESK